MEQVVDGHFCHELMSKLVLDHRSHLFDLETYRVNDEIHVISEKERIQMASVCFQ